MEPVTLETDRLVLRPWRESDRDPFAELNADPVVMEHLPQLLDRTDSDALADRIGRDFEAQGWGLFAVEVRHGADFIGFVGLADGAAVIGRPAVEVGWRLAASHWGRGYAPEGARACLRFAFDDLGLDEVVSFTIPDNSRSRRVMEKIGMELVGDFDHPRFPPESRFHRHVLYSIRSPLEARVTPR